MHRPRYYKPFFLLFQVAKCNISGKNKKARGTEVPLAPRFSRNASDYDLHETAGGMPLAAITAPNIHLSSKRRREVCKQTAKSNVPS